MSFSEHSAQFQRNLSNSPRAITVDAVAPAFCCPFGGRRLVDDGRVYYCPTHTCRLSKIKLAALVPFARKIVLLISSELSSSGARLPKNCLVVGRTELLQRSQNHLLYTPSTLGDVGEKCDCEIDRFTCQHLNKPSSGRT